MKPYAVEVAAVAERHLRAISEWWKANRPGSPGLFERELAEALRQLGNAPRSGSPTAPLARWGYAACSSGRPAIICTTRSTTIGQW